MKGRVLIIAGSDPSGGAGLQADIKTATALGGYAAAAVTALTVQNTRGVKAVHPVEPSVIREQIIAVLEDIGADAVKIGMIGSAAAGEAILDGLHAARWSPKAAPLVLDPVLAATSGDSLAEAGLAEFIKGTMLPCSFVATPNTGEAATLTGVAIADAASQRRAGEALLEMGAQAALVTGGHMKGASVTDCLVTRAGARIYENTRIETTSTHGTGCTLASALATGLAQGLPLEEAAERAVLFVHEAIRTAPGFGGGAGPLNHAHAIAAP